MIAELRSKILHLELSKGAPSESEISQLLKEREREVMLMQGELSRKEKMMQKQQVEIDELSNSIVTKVHTEVLQFFIYDQILLPL